MENEELLAIAKPIVWRRGSQASLSTEDREDLLQDVLTKYLGAWADGEVPDNVAAWFETATRNAIIDRARAADRRPADNFAEGADDPLSLLVGHLRSAHLTSKPALSYQVLGEVFALISADDAHLLRQRYLHGHSAATLAEELGISVANVDQRTTRAKRNLREALAARPDLVKELQGGHPHVY